MSQTFLDQKREREEHEKRKRGIVQSSVNKEDDRRRQADDNYRYADSDYKSSKGRDEYERNKSHAGANTDGGSLYQMK